MEYQNPWDECKIENNSVLSFVKDKCELGVGIRSNRTAVYEEYGEWCKRTRLGQQTFIKHYCQISLLLIIVIKEEDILMGYG